MIKLLLMSKNQTTNDGSRKFRKFFTSVDIAVKGEEEKGLQNKTLTVRFDKSVNTQDFKRGIITVKEENVDIPYMYSVREKDGKLLYPYVYIRKVENYEPRLPKSTAMFNLLDEEETEETEI